ncbi:MAG: HipA domain-containing protein [Cryomorphaceae bacterium]|nr:HipA domain-containing protein [Cryomorphaceae bacterium]
MKTKSEKIYVFADWHTLNGATPMGILHVEKSRGKEIFSFEYAPTWLKTQNGQNLDPDLQWYSGKQFPADSAKYNFGLFLDSSPDRWGRLLMRRKEAALAKKEGREQKQLFETDYLLGVDDQQRMGGLRFKLDINGAFKNDQKDMVCPPWSSLRKLEQISLRLEQDDAIDDSEYLNWLNMLLAPGSSLGGARPKASILDNKNQLWIAKFPSRHDDFNSGGWEMVTHELALAAGIKMAESQIKKFSSHHHTFLTKRFDRTNEGARIHFASAMTLLGHIDGDSHKDGASYLDLAEFITIQGACIEEDLEQLWRRIVLSICVSNTDDHLRNHGFLLTPKGWILSPAYDINPVENGAGLKLNISENDNALDLNLALEVSPHFRLKHQRAKEIILEVQKSVSKWRDVAKKHHIFREEQELKSRAFRCAKQVI